MKRVTMAAAAVLMLAACGGRSDGEADKAGNEAAAAGDAEDAAAGGEAGAVAMAPGQWEMRVEIAAMEVPGMPQGAMPQIPATTIRHCVTPEEAGRPGAGFLTGNQDAAQNDCTYENFSTANGRVQGTVTCRVAEGTMRTTMDGRITPTSIEMTQQMEMSGTGMPNTRTESRVTGRRVGDCEA